MCCNVLQCVAVSCSVLQRQFADSIVADKHTSNVLQCVAVCCNGLQCVAV